MHLHWFLLKESLRLRTRYDFEFASSFEKVCYSYLQKKKVYVHQRYFWICLKYMSEMLINKNYPWRPWDFWLRDRVYFGLNEIFRKNRSVTTIFVYWDFDSLCALKVDPLTNYNPKLPIRKLLTLLQSERRLYIWLAFLTSIVPENQGNMFRKTSKTCRDEV